MTDFGHQFDEAVRVTSAYGELASAVGDLRSDVTEIKGDVKAIRQDSQAVRCTLDHYAGAMVIVGSLVSIAVAILRPAFDATVNKASLVAHDVLDVRVRPACLVERI